MYLDAEPSGSRFNSIVQLEQEKGIPRNPLINAGAVVVTDDGGYLAGAVTSQAVRQVPFDHRATTPVGLLALPLPVLPVAWTGERMGPVLERMSAAEGRPVLVLDDDRRLAGVITPSDVARAALRRTPGAHPGRPQPQGTSRF